VGRVKNVVQPINLGANRGRKMDKDMIDLVKNQTQNFGSTGIAAILALFGLGDLPWELISKWHDWYMKATYEELIKEGAFIIAIVICILYKKPSKGEKREEIITLTDRVTP
jgi:hypothetical protein